MTRVIHKETAQHGKVLDVRTILSLVEFDDGEKRWVRSVNLGRESHVRKRPRQAAHQYKPDLPMERIRVLAEANNMSVAEALEQRAKMKANQA